MAPGAPNYKFNKTTAFYKDKSTHLTELQKKYQAFKEEKNPPQTSLLKDFEAWLQWKQSCVTPLPLSDQRHNAACTPSNGDFNCLTTQFLL